MSVAISKILDEWKAGSAERVIAIIEREKREAVAAYKRTAIAEIKKIHIFNFVEMTALDAAAYRAAVLAVLEDSE